MNDVHEYAKLSPWKPEQLSGWRVGDLADCPTLGRVQVAELMPPSLLQVRTASGALVKVGIYAARKVHAGATPTQPAPNMARIRHRGDK